MNIGLLDLTDNKENDLFLTIAPSGRATVSVLSGDIATGFQLTPDEEGFQQAERIRNALQKWIEHCRSIKPVSESDPVVREIDGQLVLDDPTALGMVRAVAKINCRSLLQENADRIKHFVDRVAVLGKAPRDVVIVLLNVNDKVGCVLAEALMPGHEWQTFRDRGEIPVARGLAERAGIQAAIEEFDTEAGTKLKENPDMLCVVTVQDGVAEVFDAMAPV